LFSIAIDILLVIFLVLEESDLAFQLSVEQRLPRLVIYMNRDLEIDL